MRDNFSKNWTTDNNGYPLTDENVQRYISVLPTKQQIELAEKPFYCFLHFGMNTATAREWGAGTETTADFTIKKIKPEQWIKSIKAAGATGVILTCKHHDGFCLWHTEYTDFSVKNTELGIDIVRQVANACELEDMTFGVYLSPWDMHEKTYGTEAYNDYFCNQLTELLTNYGDVNEVWFDGAKGANARSFNYDWSRYYALVRKLQPNANIAICGPDIRWVGNEGGKTRKSEFSVVPALLQSVEGTEKNSQKSEKDAKKMATLTSKDEDLGSRKFLKNYDELCWYPAEVDVSIRKGWFWSEDENKTVKSPKKLFDIYLNSVGNNCTLLLNVPPSDKGVIHSKDVRVLKKLGKKINSITAKPIVVEGLGMLTQNDGYIDFDFGSLKKLKYIVLSEDIKYSQRVEAFDIYIKKVNGKYKRVFSGTIIGSKRIAKISPKSCVGARFVIRQSRSNPVIKQIGFYE